MNASVDIAVANRRTVRELGLFLAGAFLPISVGAMMVGRHGGLAAHPLMVPLWMTAPMLSAVIVQKLSGVPIFGRRGLGLRLGRLMWWVLGPAFAALFVIASLVLSIAFQPKLLVHHQRMLLNLQHLNVPHTISPQAQLAFAIAATVFVAPVINLPIFLGEEVGWRGFMNPRLEQIFGRKGLVVGGLVWALWHLPIILLGHNYPEHPWIGLLIWIPICTCLNILLAQIAKRSSSVVPCALAHGMMNQLTMLILTVGVNQKLFVDIWHGPAGVAGLAVLLAPAVMAYVQEPGWMPILRRAPAPVPPVSVGADYRHNPGVGSAE